MDNEYLKRCRELASTQDISCLSVHASREYSELLEYAERLKEESTQLLECRNALAAAEDTIIRLRAYVQRGVTLLYSLAGIEEIDVYRERAEKVLSNV